ncbi:hypothetical protein FVEN_g12235 [Fusarium venenatum]|uniref:CBM-cenC domain-containing protein n=1 Tax=Fusarium venenatum TaxID=56646 RepID=A0A2L2TB26_9HYPO|nr:uncharacterized protein FVRRES_08241 [Fusarium venenatum]KAG8349544.1 hypothetical protein FVEN_g12235 [Fusarium venenatum]KAH6965029.1 hypothetical protein EDB82DRAFT_511412 [Fusarium venenatum]CEI68164.1 unnamed protein product [Fusarium venenatum]
MVRFSVLPAAAVTLFLFGVEASPCKPLTTGVTSIAESSSTVVPDSTETSLDSTAITTIVDATTTVQEESTETATETSFAESVSTVASDTTITSVVVTTTTAVADSTTAAQEEPTTTGAPACVETQLFINPNFDNSNDNITPWTSNGGITHTAPQSGTNAVSFTWRDNGVGTGSVQQSLSNLYGTYKFSYYYRFISASPGADYTCDMELKVGGTSLRGDFDYWQGDWRSGSVIFSDVNVAQADVQLIASCGGEFREIQVAVDTLEFKRICSL